MLSPIAGLILEQLEYGPLNEYELYTELELADTAPFTIRAELRGLERSRPPYVRRTIDARWALTSVGEAWVLAREAATDRRTQVPARYTRFWTGT